MKKLMMAAAIVCAAVVAQAASVTWQSGTITLPDGKTTAAKGDVTGYLFSMSSTQYASMLSAISDYSGPLKTDGEIASFVLGSEFSKNGTLFGSTVYASGTSLSTGVRNLTDSGSLHGTGVSGTKSIYTSGDTAYAGIIYTTGSGDAIKYLANYGSAEFTSSQSINVANMALTMNGASGSTSWQSVAVPEPTSGLLLLLGMAGLALRRRRA